jgi:predicted nucleic acid-binding protein
MKTVFVDTGYLLALELANDRNHHRAVQYWESVKQALPSLITTSYVFDETVTFLNSRGHHDKAVTVGALLLHSPSVRLLHVDESLFFESWYYFQQYQDKDYSLTDCISFVVMRQMHLSIAYAFDHHFSQAGFIREPQPA